MKQFYEVEVEEMRNESPRWWVMRAAEIVARCYTREDAEKVAAALNRVESDVTRGQS